MRARNRVLLVAMSAMLSRLLVAGELIPDRIAGGLDEPAVVWLAADTVSLIETLPPAILDTLQEQNRARQRAGRHGQAEQSGDPCRGISFAPLQSEHYLRNGTFRDLVLSSREIYAGEVLATRTGFFRGALVTMLAVHASRLKQNAGLTEVVLVPYPQATIQVNGMSYCARAHESTVIPAAGDRMLIFSYERGAGSTGTIITADVQREMVVADSRGTRAPAALQAHSEAEDGANFERIREKVAAAIKRSAQCHVE